MSGIFKAYDIRGSYPDEINEELGRDIGTAFAYMLKAERIVIGRDMRISSPALAEAFAEGVRLAGSAVVDVGMSTTPMLNYATISGGFDGGAMVTASHLPGQMNGFKLCGRNAVPLSEDSGLPAIEGMIGQGLTSEFFAAHSGLYERTDMLGQYIEMLGKFVRGPAELKVVVDAGNGTAGPEIELFFEQNTAWRLTPMHMRPDGSFPAHEANPLMPAATEELQDRVVREGADLGAAFDGDADRCMFITEGGARIRADLML
ncbi:MAG: phosphomannomutase/phosphoglucomutase, partial [Dehalococcoidia bacterium]|nr:phosphomannomutase/phosphoglucomutase [Dehalococcoidia bacterium]